MNSSYSCKNKLEKDIYELLKSKDRILIEDAELDVFCNLLKAEISFLNYKHSRCTPFKTYFSKYGDNKDLTLGLGGKVCHFVLYHGERREWK